MRFSVVFSMELIKLGMRLTTHMINTVGSIACDCTYQGNPDIMQSMSPGRGGSGKGASFSIAFGLSVSKPAELLTAYLRITLAHWL